MIVPSGLKVEDARPDYVVVELDKVVEKHLRVIVKLDRDGRIPMKWLRVTRICRCGRAQELLGRETVFRDAPG